MKLLFSFISSFLFLQVASQIPPAIQWQKTIGGSGVDVSHNIIPTLDGGYLIGGFTGSTDGDISGIHGTLGLADALVIKLTATGTIQWQKCYGGTSVEAILDIKATSDGGYIFAGTTLSNDGDVTGFHGGGLQDFWVGKIDALGNLQWQRAYGGSEQDICNSVIQTSDGGYLLSGTSKSINGDLPGIYSGSSESWLIKLNSAGTLQWQRRYGGTSNESFTSIIQTTDGGYLFTTLSGSTDGDIACAVITKTWIVKLDNTGAIQWQRCTTASTPIPNILKQTSDGGFLLGGWGSGTFGAIDGWLLKMDAGGNTQWLKFFGGTGDDEAVDLQEIAGGYIVAGSTNSPEIDPCTAKGGIDLWLFKIDLTGNIQWQRRFGGTLSERPTGYVAPVKIILTADGGLIAAGNTVSNDGDVSGNHAANTSDIWLVKFSAPDIPLIPIIAITTTKTVICPGGKLIFTAASSNAGTNPSYQWKLNGLNTATDNDTVTISGLNNGDIITCMITSNDPCLPPVSSLSNAITVTTDPSMRPVNFLPADASICRYEKLEIKPASAFTNYLWSNTKTTPTITVQQDGIYWLEVIDNDGCKGRDSIQISRKQCITGFYMPTGFTPNNDGINDLLRPTLGGEVKQYKFAIYSRWGQVVFQSTDPLKGWDGKLKGLQTDSYVFAWVCTYQLDGEPMRTIKGTVLLIR